MRSSYLIALFYALTLAALAVAAFVWAQPLPPPPGPPVPIVHPSGGGGTGARCNRRRVTTGAVNAGAYANVAVAWLVNFADTNYTINCSVLEATSAAVGLDVNHIQAVAVGSATVTVHNGASGPLTGTVECIAIHD